MNVTAEVTKANFQPVTLTLTFDKEMEYKVFRKMITEYTYTIPNLLYGQAHEVVPANTLLTVLKTISAEIYTKEI